MTLKVGLTQGRRKLRFARPLNLSLLLVFYNNQSLGDSITVSTISVMVGFTGCDFR